MRIEAIQQYNEAYNNKKKKKTANQLEAWRRVLYKNDLEYDYPDVPLKRISLDGNNGWDIGSGLDYSIQ